MNAQVTLYRRWGCWAGVLERYGSCELWCSRGRINRVIAVSPFSVQGDADVRHPGEGGDKLCLQNPWRAQS